MEQAMVKTTTMGTVKRRRVHSYERVFMERLIRAVETIEKSYLEAGKLMSEAYHSGQGIREMSIWHKLGHESFAEFVEQRTGWSVRRAYALIGAADAIAKYEISEEDAVAVKSTKMSLIAAHAKQWELGRDEVMECVNKAKITPWDDFIEWISARKEPADGDVRKGGPVTRVMYLRFGSRERDWVSGILEKAREVVAERESKKALDISREQALSTILREWAEMKGLIKTEEAVMQ